MQEAAVEWIGRSLQDVRAFPAEARRELGHDLFLVQQATRPRHWRPMTSVGPGAIEIRVRTGPGGRIEYRIVYVAKFPEAVYVLHAFQKTTRRTSHLDLDMARRRYHEMLELREQRR